MIDEELAVITERLASLTDEELASVLEAAVLEYQRRRK